MGGDEFVAVLVDLNQPGDCIPVIERLLQAAATVVRLPSNTEAGDSETGESVQVSASIGVTFYPQDNVAADVMLRHADQAMHLAKQAGKNRFTCLMLRGIRLFKLTTKASSVSRRHWITTNSCCTFSRK